MTMVLHEANQGTILDVQVSGRLTKEDYANFVPEVNRLVAQNGKISILFDMHDFHGWSPAGMWEDAKFAMHHFSDIVRLAVVGEKRWQRVLTQFCRIFNKAEIRYFEREHLEEARRWLQN